MSELPIFHHNLLLNENHHSRDDDSSSSSDGSLLISYKTRKAPSKDLDSNSSSEDDDLIIKYKSKKKSSHTLSVKPNDMPPIFHFPTEKESIEARKSWHLEMLLGLFINCTDSELNHFNTQSQAHFNCIKDPLTQENFNENRIESSTGKHTYANLERKRSILELNGHDDSDGDILDSKLPILYYIIEERLKWESKVPLMAGMKLERRLSNKKRRLPYTSRSLQNLELKVRGDFAKNMVDINVFQPCSLQYNECSISCMSKWAFQTKKKKRCINYVYEPLAPKDFRKCAICNRFGHFEVECKELGLRQTLPREEMVEALKAEELVAKEVRVQSALNAFIKEQEANDECLKCFPAEDKTKSSNEASVSAKMDETLPNSAFDTSLHFSNNHRSGKSVPSSLESEGISCHVCGSSHNTSNILQCAGCGFNVHQQCAESPKRDNDSNYWCDDCYNYDSDVSSITEIEGLDGFVIEQRKSNNRMHDFNDFSGSIDFYKKSWSAALVLTSADTTDSLSDIEESDDNDQNMHSLYEDELEEIKNLASEDPIQNSQKIIPRPSEWAKAEVTVIDGVSILSRSKTEKVSEIEVTDAQYDTRFENEYKITQFEDIIPKVKVPYRGRIGGLAIFKVNSHDAQNCIIKFGAVAGYKQGKVLIYNLPNLNLLMHELLEKNISENTSDKSSIDILSCHIGASEWIPISRVIHLSNFLSKRNLQMYQRSIDEVLTRLKYGIHDGKSKPDEEYGRQIDTPVEDDISEFDMPDVPSSQTWTKSNDQSHLRTLPRKSDTTYAGAADTRSDNTGSRMAHCSTTETNDNVTSNKFVDRSKESSDMAIPSTSENKDNAASNKFKDLSKEPSVQDSENDRKSNLPSGEVHVNTVDADGDSDKYSNTLQSKRTVNKKQTIELSQKRHSRASRHSLNDKDGESIKNKVQDNKTTEGTRAKNTTKTSVSASSNSEHNDQIFQVDSILDDNGIRAKNRQYLIRWKGFSNKYNTWEREENIFDYAIIKQYWCKKYIQLLKRTKEAKDPKSHTTKIIRVLEYGLTTLGESELNTDRVCSFCNRKIRKYDSNHKLIHSAEPNYSIIRDIILIALPEWYTPFENWASG